MILHALWFFLPAGVANGIPVLASKLPIIKNWAWPLDCGKTWRGKRLLGNNKTWRGLIVGVIAALGVIAAQKYLFTHNLWVLEHSWFDYRPLSIWLLGPLMAIGALLADAVESFIKRQRNIGPGVAWFPFDQTDYIIGGCLLSLAVVRLHWVNYVAIFLTWFGMHLIIVYLGYLAGIRDRPI